MRKITVLLAVLTMFTAGCSLNFYKTTPHDKATIQSLKGEVGRLSELRERERDLREREREEFGRIRDELERKLKGRKVGVEIQERGVVITLGSNILFDPGRAKIKDEAVPVLDKIANVIKTTAVKKNIGVEGHTDNVPIKYSGWKSNRELSTARANNVYHYLVSRGIAPGRLTTMGYGEYRPVASNDTKEGRAKNRRVEIVILPQFKKIGGQGDVAAQDWVK